jgi:hypothetical protein
MKDKEFLLVIGTVWIAPHSNSLYSAIVGCILFVLAFLMANGENT